ncbi:MAG: hypothetical protein GY937_08195 [bacterium]|nr:hypothetical protein [bacterium]
MKLNRIHLLGVLLLGLIVATGTGCKSLWASFTSPSDSVSGSFNSISGSVEALFDGISQSCSGTKPSKSELAYGDDVRVMMRAFVETAEPADGLLRAIGQVAEQHGIDDWEAEVTTFHALGMGFSQAGFDADQTRTYLASLGLAAGDNLHHIQEGSVATAE